MPTEISVVIPTRDRAHTIERAVRSALDQRGVAVQVVVADDRSVDDTAARLHRLNDPRLHYMPPDGPAGANAARNRGAGQATAPLIAFLDSDDAFRPGHLAAVRILFDADAAIDACLSSFAVLRGTAHRLVRLPRTKGTGPTLRRLLLAHAIPLTCSAIVVRRPVFDRIGGFDPDLDRHQDRDLLLRLAHRHVVAFDPMVGVTKFQNRESFSRHPRGYISGLDALLTRHPLGDTPEDAWLRAYLIARPFISALFQARPHFLWSELRDLRRARHLPPSLASGLWRYRTGRRVRNHLAQAFQVDGCRQPNLDLLKMICDSEQDLRKEEG